MTGKVETWQMTPDQLEAYKKNNPPSNIKQKKQIDWNWRGKRAADSRWNKSN